MVNFKALSFSVLAATHVVALPASLVTRKEPTSGFASQTTCNGKTYTYRNLAGYGFVPGNARDKYGDTVNFGSSLKISDWSLDKTTGAYSGILWGLPDRGWNTEGTINFQPRLHKYQISFTPKASSATPNLLLTYITTILLTDPSGIPMTGLDPTGVKGFAGFADLPAATYVGDGFGGAGPGGTRISLDAEGLVLAKDGGFWISDEYLPGIYSFSPEGKMRKAIVPPNAILPLRNGTINYSANSPPRYDPGATVIPANPTQGRSNNQGLEGLTASYDGKNLYALMQSALTQEGGNDKTTNNNARLLKYDISGSDPRYAGEWVVQLPQYVDPTKSAKNNPRTAAQSEILSLGDDQFLVLARDSNFGNHGSSGTMSNYRQADIFDISNATNIKGMYDNFNNSITVAPNSKVLLPSITPALYCGFLNYNNNTELAKFGLHNGGAVDDGLLNEKWESLALLPVDGGDGDDDEWFLFSASDNDFVTTDGYINFGQDQYSDASGMNLNNQVQVFRIKLPDHSRPFARTGDGKDGLTVT